MTKYKYQLVGRDQAEKRADAEEMINAMGAQGYRLTIVSDWFFLFELEVIDSPVFIPEPHIKSH